MVTILRGTRVIPPPPPPARPRPPPALVTKAALLITAASQQIRARREMTQNKAQTFSATTGRQPRPTDALIPVITEL